VTNEGRRDDSCLNGRLEVTPTPLQGRLFTSPNLSYFPVRCDRRCHKSPETASGRVRGLLYRLLKRWPGRFVRFASLDLVPILPKATERRTEVAAGRPKALAAEEQCDDEKKNDQLPTADAAESHGIFQFEGTTRLIEVLDRTMTGDQERSRNFRTAVFPAPADGGR
jgi:hypothetical protein